MLQGDGARPGCCGGTGEGRPGCGGRPGCCGGWGRPGCGWGTGEGWDAAVPTEEGSMRGPLQSGNQRAETSSSTQILEIAATRGSPLRLPLNKRDQRRSPGQWLRQLTTGRTAKSALCHFRLGDQMRYLLSFSRPLFSRG